MQVFEDVFLYAATVATLGEKVEIARRKSGQARSLL